MRFDKWLYITKFSAKSQLAGISMNLLYLVASSIELGSLIYLYYINKSIDFQQVVSHFMLSRLYHGFVMNRAYYFVSDQIYVSGMTRLLLYPTNYFLNNFMLSLGGRIFKNIFSIITSVLVIVVLFAFQIAQIKPDFSFLSLLLLVPFGFYLNFVLSLATGHLGFFIKDRRDYNGFVEIYYIVFAILSGLVIPLYLIPVDWLNYTPFAYIVAQPMKLYQNFSFELFGQVLAGTIFWIVVVFFANRFIFKSGLKKNEAVGL
jgi:ABC-type uncharacterized transport system permease subunit